MLDKFVNQLMESATLYYMPRIEEMARARKAELEEMKVKVRTSPAEVEAWFGKEIQKLSNREDRRVVRQRMLQALLEDRFGLKTHRSQKEFSVYVLERGKRPFTLTEVQPTDEPEGIQVLPIQTGGMFGLWVVALAAVSRAGPATAAKW